MMHSFYIDSIRGIGLYSKEEGSNDLLDSYLATDAVGGRIDLRSEYGREFFASNLQKSEFCAGSFPLKARLNDSQNFAINSAFKRFDLASKDDFWQNTGFYAINRAPGTGKTTILKEMCASIFTARAMELAKLDESEITINGLLNPRLYGFDMTIFSSNNLAVENVSAELSNPDDIDENLFGKLLDVDYFSSIASKYWGKKSWGAFGFRLGNSENIKKFVYDFCCNVNEAGQAEKFDELSKLYPELVIESDEKRYVMGFRSFLYENRGSMSFEGTKKEFLATLKELDEFLKEQKIDERALKDEQAELFSKLTSNTDPQEIKTIAARLKEINDLLSGKASKTPNV